MISAAWLLSGLLASGMATLITLWYSRSSLPWRDYDAKLQQSAAWLPSHIRRRPALLVAALSLVVGLVVTAIAAGFVLVAPHKDAADLNAALSTVLTGGIFLLAFIGGIVALLAYAESSRRPHLKVTWRFFSIDGQEWGPFLFRDRTPRKRVARDLPADVAPGAIPLQPVVLEVRIENDGDAIARNVAVLVHLDGILFSPTPPSKVESPPYTWAFRRTPSGGWFIQWEGGVDLPIYPGTFPRSPKVRLDNIWAAPVFQISRPDNLIVFADGIAPDPQPLQLQCDGWGRSQTFGPFDQFPWLWRDRVTR